MADETEQNRIDRIANDSWYAHGVIASSIKHCFTIFNRHMKPGPTLELGPAEGLMTQLLATTGNPLTLVDGSAAFCASLQKRFPQASVHCSLFEEMRLQGQFENIVLGHVLEHVEQPVEILRRVGELLTPQGHVFINVPNAHSLHRQIAVSMGLLRHEAELNEMDRHHGHRRVYDTAALHRDIIAAGLSIRLSGGYWIKPISNAQIEQQWTDQMVASAMAVGERYPDIAAEIYAIAVREPAPGK